MVKKIWIYDNESLHSQETSKKLREKLLASGSLRTKEHQASPGLIQTQLVQDGHFEFNEESPDIVISIGGDGTMLSAFHKYETQADKIRFVGVHTGHLGFYTDFLSSQLDEVVAALKNEDPRNAVHYPLLKVKVNLDDGNSKSFYALNESTVRRGAETLVAEVNISGFIFEKFRGDGLVVSTPTGSTAYNKSIGGAVMHPQVEAMQMAEIASINNRIFRTLGSPMIVAKKDSITIIPESENELWFTIDQKEYKMTNLKEVVYSLDGHTIAFANCAHTPFWSRVRNNFIGSE
ncbi:NAD kinase [Lactovum miscens]|uniref:NAD kinase n=1 Tax=Lactovum miscens TaxID=190387 RepID=A0A841C6L1_9LACT|nr:NAD kinase [Lactovum miscens]MBB5888105.1 NAD+ kinase [Lactovum miscens]